MPVARRASTHHSSGAFDPLSLSPGMWLDASDLASITASGGNVSQWNDKSGNGRHVSQATGAFQPRTGDATQNSLNVLTWGSGQLMASSAFTQAQPITVFAVGKSFDNTNTNAQVIANDATTPTVFRLSGQMSLYAGSVLSASNGVDTTTCHVFSGVFNGASSALYQDGTSIATGDAGSSGYSSKRFVVGCDPSSSSFAWVGSTCEVLMYPSSLSTGNRQAVEAYLKAKWGTP